MKDLPSVVVVYGRRIEIKYVDSSTLEKHIEGASGVWEPFERCIYIDKDAPREIQLYFIYHELGHAVLHFTGLDQAIPDKLQEVVVQSNATLIEDILRQADVLK